MLKHKTRQKQVKFGDHVRLNKKYRIFKKSICLVLLKKNLWFPELCLRNLRPKLIKEFPFDKDDLIKIDNNIYKVFYKIEEDSLMLSTFCNWVFTNLHQTSYLYSDVEKVQSQEMKRQKIGGIDLSSYKCYK